MKIKYLPSLLLSLFILPSVALAAPQVFYTDITSGPVSGGEGGNGAYISIFGTGFGATQSGSTVTINNVAVATYKVWSDTRISVQPGPSVTSGAIRVTVGGNVSNTDVTFTVRPGDIYFLSLTGNNATCVANDINLPCRNPRTVFNLPAFGAGDHMVLRGGTWTDTNTTYSSFFSLEGGKGGTATDHIVLMAYPGEVVRVPRSGNQRGIHAFNSPGGFTVSGLIIDMQGGSGTPFGFPPGAAANFGNRMQNVRAVNNEIMGMISPGGGSAAMEGRGRNLKYLGNYIHNNGIPSSVATGAATCPGTPGVCSSKLYHSIYFDNNDRNGTDNVEIAYNIITHQGGGRGVQIYNSNNECGSGNITNVSVHHNVIHDIALDGIIFADCNGTGMVAYDNIVYRTAIAAYQTDGAGGGCIRFNNSTLVANVYNNTFIDCAQDNDPDSGSIRVQCTSSAGLTLRNNLVAYTGSAVGNGYFTNVDTSSSSCGSGATVANRIASATNNLWFGAGTAPSWSSNSVTANPLFISASTGNFQLNGSSPAINAGSSAVAPLSTDIDGRVRPQGAGYDIGAFEASGVVLPSPTNVRITKQ